MCKSRTASDEEAVFCLNRLTVCVTGAGAGVDSAWEQEKLEARKMLAVGAAESPASSARFVGRRARPRLSGGGTKICK